MIYSVVVDLSNNDLDRLFDYSGPDDFEPGDRVLVPFGRRVVVGYVAGVKDSTEYAAKDIIRKLDPIPAVVPELLALCEFLKARNNLRRADTLRLCVPPGLRAARSRRESRYARLAMDRADALSALRANATRQIELVSTIPDEGEFESSLNARCGPGAAKSLEKKGILAFESRAVGRVPLAGLDFRSKRPVLSDEQAEAAEAVLSSDRPCLVHGVTSSGKTEVYMSVIESCLRAGKTAIMLVPEIGLTPQMLGRFRGRFGDSVALIHSRLSDGERVDEWLRLRSGEASIALGTRSAIFAPLENIGAIILDEEHDSSYVSESNPRYHTRDIALFRAKHNGAKLVFGSATPSVDSYYLALRGDYALIEMTERTNLLPLPKMLIADMREELRAGNDGLFSRALLTALSDALRAGNQAMIYINRRGYASFMRCGSCGYVPKCTDCDVSLAYHRKDSALKCHYCGKKFRPIVVCPKCGSTNIRLGRIGTETVMASLRRIFPDARLSRLDTDVATQKEETARILGAFARGEADILVGTQMIAKGHDFPNVTLVGVLDADLTLYTSDYRCNEVTFQQITQVAGRAGRDEKEGRVIIQTHNPDHFVFRYAASYDYKGFYAKECEIREGASFPPYSKIARVLIKSESEKIALESARSCYNALVALKSARPGSILRVQAMAAPIRRISNEYRFQTVAWVAERSVPDVLPEIYSVADRCNSRRSIAFVEINPTNMA